MPDQFEHNVILQEVLVLQQYQADVLPEVVAGIAEQTDEVFAVPLLFADRAAHQIVPELREHDHTHRQTLVRYHRAWVGEEENEISLSFE